MSTDRILSNDDQAVEKDPRFALALELTRGRLPDFSFENMIAAIPTDWRADEGGLEDPGAPSPDGKSLD